MAAHNVPFAAALLLAALVLGAHAGTAQAAFSALWGENGELWNGKGPLGGQLFDWSFAGYKQGNEPLPSPPITRSIMEFDDGSMNDTAILKAALDWANSQPLTDDFIVLSIPAGEYVLDEVMTITRSRVVLRGEGRNSTVLFVPKSLYDVYGQNPEENAPRGYINNGGFITIQGTKNKGAFVADVIAPAAHGDTVITLSDTSGLEVGQYVDTAWTDVDGNFNTLMFDNQWRPPATYDNSTRVRFASRIQAIDGNMVTLERHLPYDIMPGIDTAQVFRQPDTVVESGVEGLTFHFEWEPYAGHHLERGWNGVHIREARDCWARDIGTINADNSVLVSHCTAITVKDVKIEFEKSRENFEPNVLNEPANFDGHWGIQHEHSFDVLADTWLSTGNLAHDIGTGTGGKWGVYMNGNMKDRGNLDLHRALSGPTLYTNINVGLGVEALMSGGPPRSGPNALAGTTWWNIMSTQPVDPNKSNGTAGDCSYGPVINLVGVDIKPNKVDQMCPTWFYERDPTIPPNLYDAMVQVRRSRGPTPVISSYPQGAASPAEAPGRWGQQAPAGERAPAQTAASPIQARLYHAQLKPSLFLYPSSIFLLPRRH